MASKRKNPMNPIIQSFYDQISWVNECTIVQINNLEFVQTNLCLYLPTDWEYVEGASKTVTITASKLNLEPALIVGGNPSKADAERICWAETTRGLLVTFVDPVARTAQSQCITRALDGLDWGRTVEAIANGSKSPVWDWD